MADLCNTPAVDGEPLMSMLEVRRFFGGATNPLSEATIWRWVKQGKLAKPIICGVQTRRWLRSDCQKTLDVFIAASGRSQKGPHT